MTFKPSKYQKAIYTWIKNGEGNSIIQAVAGSGKTTTIIEATKLLPKDKKSIFLAFNRSIANELKERLPENIEARTLHSLGLSMFYENSNTRPQVKNNKLNDIIFQTLNELNIKEHKQPVFFAILKKLVPLIKATMINHRKFEELEELKYRFGIEVVIDEFILDLIDNILDKCKNTVGIIDYDDMLWVPVVNNWKAKTYDWVFVDECQDLNKVQFELVKKICNGHTRIVAVGDRQQCQPAGTIISLQGGKIIDIKDIKINDKVISYSRDWRDGFKGINTQAQVVENKQERNYTGLLYTIKALNYQTQCTPNHKFPIRINGYHNKWITYLMKKGDNFRIGQCSLFYQGYKKEGKRNRTFVLNGRTRQEDADCSWVLGVYDTEIDSKIDEQVLSYNYGLPTIRFVPFGKKLNRWNQNNLQKVFNGIENQYEKAKKLLSKFDRNIDYPFWIRNQKYRKKIINRAKKDFIVETCNLIPEIMSINIFEGEKESNWQPLQIDKKYVENIKVYSLKISKNETYIADNLLTHNSIYAFRGANTTSMDNFKDYFKAEEFPLSISYRCPRKVVELAKEIVPGIERSKTAKEGIVADIDFDNTVEQTKDGDLILCRTNAPLIKVAFALIRAHKKAVVRGRDIGKNLIKIVNKYNVINLDDLNSKIINFRELQEEKIMLIEQGKRDKKQKNSLMTLIDSCDTILAISENVETVEELKEKIEEIFTDDREGIVCSTVHKAKGLEADNIYIVNEDMMPHPMATTDEEIEQEMNIRYVAITRAKEALYFIRDKL